ncbi:MAG: acyl-CoA dehydrogenase family protein [Deltaproteobacteria bacterium]|nr:acyl-CoA dehydrogenase family protein [Deltaproteobacteria bacterium]
MVDLELSVDERLIQETARRLAEAEIRPRAAAADREETFPAIQVGALAREGFMAMLVPADYGGAEVGAVAYSLAITEVARCCASTAVTMAVTNMVGDAIATFGTEAQRRSYLPRLASGEMVAGSFALSEPDAGSDAGAVTTRAVKEDGRYRLNGNKCWITSGDRAGVFLVFAKTDPNPSARTRGISAFLVEPGQAGVVVGPREEKLGLRASGTVSLSLEDVDVPESARLGAEGEGFKIAMRALDGGRIGVGSQAIGIGLASLEASRTYAMERHQFGRAISEFQAIQWKVADMALELDAARLLVLRAASMKDRGVPFTKEASMAKLFATESANRAAAQAIQIHGGYGFTRSFDVERQFRDVRVTTIYEGTSEIQRIVIARAVLGGA